MKQTSSLTRRMTDAQEVHSAQKRFLHHPYYGPLAQAERTTKFTIYTEAFPNLSRLVSRYFSGATLQYGIGLWNNETEDAAVITIFAPADRLQDIYHLIGDIRQTNQQHTVIYTAESIAVTNVSEPDLD